MPRFTSQKPGHFCRSMVGFSLRTTDSECSTDAHRDRCWRRYCGVCVLIGVAAKLAVQAQQFDHGLAAAWSEAAEQVDEDRVVRSHHNGRMEGDVRVDVRFDVAVVIVMVTRRMPDSA